MRNGILIFILLLTVSGVFYSIFKIFYKNPYDDYSDDCKTIVNIGHRNMTPEPGTYYSINCYSDNYSGLKTLNNLRKSIQSLGHSDNYYSKFYCFGVDVGSNYSVEDYGLDFVLKNSVIMTVYPTALNNMDYLNAIVFDFDHKDSLNTNPIITKSKSQIYFTYKNMGIFLNRKSLQAFINTIKNIRSQKKYKNCTYEFINKEGVVKIIYNDNADFFRFEIQ